MMNLFVWCPGRQCQFVNCSQTTVLRRHRVACRFSIPKRQQIQSRHCKIFSAPRYVDTDDIDLSLADLRRSRNRANKVFDRATMAEMAIFRRPVDETEGRRRLAWGNQLSR